MLLGWLLPDASVEESSAGWRRPRYRPRHGRPPLAVRGALCAASAVGRARERYLGAGDDEGIPAMLLPDPASGRAMDQAGLRLAADWPISI